MAPQQSLQLEPLNGHAGGPQRRPARRGFWRRHCSCSCTINWKMFPVKCALFAFYGGLGCLMPFLSLHMMSIGLTHLDITFINTILPIFSLIGPPLASLLADVIQKHKLITIICMLLAGLSALSLLLVPPVVRNGPSIAPIQLWCDESGSRMTVLPCDEQTSQDPCKHFTSLPFPVSSTFRVDNCRYQCSNGSSMPYRSPNELIKTPDSSSKKSGFNSTSFIAPMHEIEASTPSTPPHLCLVDASRTENCIQFPRLSDSFSYNRTLDLSSAMLVDTGDSKSCEFRQYDVLVDQNSYYENMVCHPDPGCSVVCNATEMTSGTKFLQEEECNNIGGNWLLTVSLYILARSIADFFPAVILSLLDTMTLGIILEDGRDLASSKGDFGRQKLFGLVAVGVTAPVVGVLMDQFDNTESYRPVFFAFGVLMTIASICTYFIPFKSIEKSKSGLSLSKSLWKLITCPELLALFALMCVLGAFWNYLETFLYIYLEMLQSPKSLIGLTVTVGILPSIPFLYKSAPILDYCGHHNLLILAFLFYAVRFFGYALTNYVWVFLVYEALELFTLNLLQVVGPTLAFQLAPKEVAATAQSLVWVAHFVVGRSIGAMVSGQLISVYGMTMVFYMAAWLATACCIVYIVVYHVIIKMVCKKPKTSIVQEDTPPAPIDQQHSNGNLANGVYRPIPTDGV